jgi:hypothetical protein
MKVYPPFRHPVRVEMHLPGGFSRVILIDVCRGSIRWEIPTDKIPLHLRRIGSEFLVIMPRFHPEASDSDDEIRAMLRQVEVVELSQEG